MKIVCNCCHERLVENNIDWDKCKEFPRAEVVKHGLYNKCSSCINQIMKKNN